MPSPSPFGRIQLFLIKRPTVLFFTAHLRLFRSQSPQIDSSCEWRGQTKRAKKRCRHKRFLFFLDMNTEFFKLHIVWNHTRRFLIRKNSLYFSALFHSASVPPHFICSGNGTVFDSLFEISFAALCSTSLCWWMPLRVFFAFSVSFWIAQTINRTKLY